MRRRHLAKSPLKNASSTHSVLFASLVPIRNTRALAPRALCMPRGPLHARRRRRLRLLHVCTPPAPCDDELAAFLFSVLPNVFRYFNDLEVENSGSPQWLLGMAYCSKIKVVPISRPSGFDVEYNAVQGCTSFCSVQVIICKDFMPRSLLAFCLCLWYSSLSPYSCSDIFSLDSCGVLVVHRAGCPE